jgi:SagB-type dehydrogenase family enzyme
MAIIRLRSPSPRTLPFQLPDIQWPTALPRPLPPPTRLGPVDVFRVLDERRTTRRFCSVTAGQLSTFLWYSARTRLSYLDGTGRRFESKPAPSAGGCHPHDLLIVRPSTGRLVASMYDSRRHALAKLNCRRDALYRFVKNVADAVPPERGIIVWLVGQTQRTDNYYRFSETLVWRDAGALVGVMAVVAESLDLSFCPVGATGDPYIANLVGNPRYAYGFGGAVLGGRRSPAQDRHDLSSRVGRRGQ